MAGTKIRTDPRGSIGELVTALMLLLIGCGGVYLSLQLDRPRSWYTAPGVVPLFLSLGMAAMAGLLVINAIRHGAITGAAVRQFRSTNKAVAIRFAVAAGATAIFYFGLLTVLPFEIAGFLFLLIMFRVFWREGRWWTQVLAAGSVTIALVLSFQLLFDIPFPGKNNLFEAITYQLRYS